MDNEELKEYLTKNFSELMPSKDGYFENTFKPEFYVKKVLPIIIEKNFSTMKKMIEQDSKIPMGYIGHFPPPPNKDDRLTIDELNNYNAKLLIASDNFNKNPFDANIEELLITIDRRMMILDCLLS